MQAFLISLKRRLQSTNYTLHGKRTVDSNQKTEDTSRGFTLIEVLVVIAVLGIIGYILSDLLSRSYRGSTKTSLLGSVKQNGQIALDLMTNDIRNAELVLCSKTTPTASIVSFRDKSGGYFRLRMQNQTIREDYPDLTSLDLSSATAAPTVCDESLVVPEKEGKGLIDSTQFLVDSGSLTVSSNPGYKDIISITFKLKLLAPGLGFENQLGGDGKVEFNTSAQLR